MRFAAIAIALMLCQVANGQEKPRKVKLADEVKALRQEVASLRLMIEKLLAKQVPATRMEWRQVREPVQLEGGIDDGYELVPVKR